MTIAARLRAMADAIDASAAERSSALRALADEIDRAAGDPWIGERDFAEGGRFAGYSWRAVLAAISDGELVAGRIGRTPVVRLSTLDAWIAERGRAPKSDALADYERALVPRRDA